MQRFFCAINFETLFTKTRYSLLVRPLRPITVLYLYCKKKKPSVNEFYFRMPCPHTCKDKIKLEGPQCTVVDYAKEEKTRKNFTMNGSDWLKVTSFAANVGWDFLFDFNVLKRSGEI